MRHARSLVGARAAGSNIPQSTASRTIAILEREIGVVLFVRTTRAVTLTDAGSDFLARRSPVLAELDEAEHAAHGTGELHGILQIGLGTNFAVREIIPRLAAFMSRHPALQMRKTAAGPGRQPLATGSVGQPVGALGRIRRGNAARSAGCVSCRSEADGIGCARPHR